MPEAGDDGEGSQEIGRCSELREIFARNRKGHECVSAPSYGGVTVEERQQLCMDAGIATLLRLGSGHAKLSDPAYDRGPQTPLTSERFVARSRKKIDECCWRTQQDLFNLRHAGKVGLKYRQGPCDSRL